MKRYPNIKYSFTPKNYWSDANPLAAILRNVKGENRRKMIRDHWNAGKLDHVDPSLLRDEVDDNTRQRLGRIHPSFMDGEYLPPYLPLEVEIVRICLESTTSDVISLRARPTGKSIVYRVVDEYKAKFILPILESTKPLSFTEIIRQLDDGTLDDSGFPAGGLALGYNEYNRIDTFVDDLPELRHFTRINSDYYPQLFEHYERVFEEWHTEMMADRSKQD